MYAPGLPHFRPEAHGPQHPQGDGGKEKPLRGHRAVCQIQHRGGLTPAAEVGRVHVREKQKKAEADPLPPPAPERAAVQRAALPDGGQKNHGPQKGT